MLWFSARWCAPCKQMAPIIDQISGVYQHRLHIIRIDIDEQPDTAAEFGIRAVPTLVLIGREKMLSFTVGITPFPDLKNWINLYLN